MADVKSVGAYLYRQYYTMRDEKMDEMKMHKLMYFSQRESLMVKEDVLFDEDFYGWKYGPVLKSVRAEFRKKHPYDDAADDLEKDDKELLDGVMNRYGALSSWKLSSLSHDEFSWKKSRDGLKAEDNGDVKMELKAMRVDAAREKALRKKRAELMKKATV